MTRELRVVAPGEALAALRDALAGGPAVHVAAGGRPGPDLPATVEQRIALVVETSGSTGRPKRVALSADALLASAAASESALGGPGQWVLTLPTHYIAGINVLVRSIAAGIDPVEVGGEHFTPDHFVDAARRLSIPERFVSIVPAQLATLLDDREATIALRGFTRVLVGGQSLPAALRDRADEAGIAVTRTYGSSETSGGCVYDGAPIGQTTVRIEDGEVWLGGPTLAEGYLGDETLTSERLVTADGARWFRTSDAGTWDGSRLQITGRLDDVIISGGVKIPLGAVERIVRDASGFTEVVVVGVPDPRWGEVPVIVTPESAEFGPAIEAVRRELGRHARPARVLRVDRIPYLASGKPDRVALTAAAARAAG